MRPFITTVLLFVFFAYLQPLTTASSKSPSVRASARSGESTDGSFALSGSGGVEIALNSDGLFVAEGNQVHRLGSSLDYKETYNFTGAVIKMVVLLGVERKLLVCHEVPEDMKESMLGDCDIYKWDQDGGLQEENMLQDLVHCFLMLASTGSPVIFSADSQPDSFYIGESIATPNGSATFTVLRHCRVTSDLDDDDDMAPAWNFRFAYPYHSGGQDLTDPSPFAGYDLGYQISSNENFKNGTFRELSYGFVGPSSEFAYFFALDGDSQGFVDGVKVLRVCHETHCKNGKDYCLMDSWYEALLVTNSSCLANTTNVDVEICDVSLFVGSANHSPSSGEGEPEPLVVVTLCGECSGSSFYRLSDIDSTMESKYEACEEGEEDVELSWSEGSCDGFEAVGPLGCNFKRYVAAIGTPEVSPHGSFSVEDAHASINITAAVGIEQSEGMSMLYGIEIRNSTYEGYALCEVQFSEDNDENGDSSSEASVNILYHYTTTSPTEMRIQQLVWTEGVDYVIAVTDTEVFQVDLSPVPTSTPDELPPTSSTESCNTSSSCGDCLDARHGINPDCIWCLAGDNSRCTTSTECDNESLKGDCSVPKLRTIDPPSGHVKGGTKLLLKGDEALLGITKDKIHVVKIGSEWKCNVTSVETNGNISCITPELPYTGNYSIWVLAENAGGDDITSNPIEYEAVDPRATAINISAADIDDHILVTIKFFGSHLDAGSARVSFSGIETSSCEILDKTYEKIECVIPASELQDPAVEVLVSIDGHTVGVFNLSVFLSVHPQATIFAGGTQLTFEGMRFKKTDNPELITSFPSAAIGNCSVVNSTVLTCTSPPIVNPTTSNQAFGEIDYTIIMVSGTGPDTRNENLKISVYPNPTFPAFEVEEGMLRIMGDDLLYVLESEYSVFVGGEECQNLTVDSEENVLVCTPGTEGEIQVHVGAFLKYNIGNYTISSSPSLRLIISVPVVTVLLALAAVVGVVTLIAIKCCCHCKTSKHDHDDLTFDHTERSTSFRTPDDEDEVYYEAHSRRLLKQKTALRKKIPSELIVYERQLRLLETIGQGEFGVVFKGYLIKNGETKIVAVKTLRGLYTPVDVQNLIAEVIKMHQLDHSHVVPLLGVCMDSGPALALVLPYMANGNLLSYLRKDQEYLRLEAGVEHDANTVRLITL